MNRYEVMWVTAAYFALIAGLWAAMITLGRGEYLTCAQIALAMAAMLVAFAGKP